MSSFARLVLLPFFLLVIHYSHAQINTFPYFEDFESGDGGFVAGGTNSTWELGTPSNTVINSTFSGTNTWVTNLDGKTGDNEDSYIQSPVFDFTGFAEDPILIFQSVLIVSQCCDQFFIEVSTDGGATYDLLGTSENLNWYDSPEGFEKPINDFRQFSHALDGTAGFSNVIIRFRFKTIRLQIFGDEGVGLDDFEIKGMATFNNIAISEINLPEISPFFSDNETLEVTVINTGGTTLTLGDINVTLEGSSTTQFNESLDFPLSPGVSQIIILGTTLDLATSGDYDIEIVIQASENEDIHDDNIFISKLGKIDVYNDGLPYFENFENAEGITNGNTTNIEGLQSFSFLPSSPDAFFFVFLETPFQSNQATILAGIDETSDALITLNLSNYDVGMDQLRIGMKLANVSSGNLANTKIFIRGNANNNWINLFDYGAELPNDGLVKLFSFNTISQLLMDNAQTYGEAFQVRIGHENDGAIQIDDLIIEEISDFDAAIASAIAPPISPLLGSSEVISVELSNEGLMAIADIPLSAVLIDPDGAVTNAEEIANITLQPGESAVYDFTTPFDFSLGGNYEINLSTGLMGDKPF